MKGGSAGPGTLHMTGQPVAKGHLHRREHEWVRGGLTEERTGHARTNAALCVSHGIRTHQAIFWKSPASSRPPAAVGHTFASTDHAGFVRPIRRRA